VFAAPERSACRCAGAGLPADACANDQSEAAQVPADACADDQSELAAA